MRGVWTDGRRIEEANGSNRFYFRELDGVRRRSGSDVKEHVWICARSEKRNSKIEMKKEEK